MEQAFRIFDSVSSLFHNFFFTKKFQKAKKIPQIFYSISHSPLSFVLIMESNEQPEEDEECSICLDRLPKDASKFMRARCCGKGMHFKCRDGVLVSSMSHKQKNHCVMCRTKYPNGSKEEIEQLRPWVVKEKAWAQSMLGQNYAHGEGVEQSYQRAKELWELAANQGDAAAQNNLGILYANGHGVEQSFEAAREWWMKSAEQGNEQAITGLQQLDEFEGRTTPSFTPPKRCSTCDAPKTSTHKLRNCKCKDRHCKWFFPSLGSSFWL